MELRKRAITTEDYPLLFNWWEAQNHPAILPQLWPKTGLLLSSAKEPLAAGFLYKSDGGVAHIEWIVANPYSDKMERRAAIKELIASLTLEAKDAGYHLVFGATDHPAMPAHFEAAGFNRASQNVKTYFRRVK